MRPVDSSLYWSLPTPMKFIHELADAAKSSRAVIISLPREMSIDPQPAILRALQGAGIIKPVVLSIGDGANISVTIGRHFDDRSMPAELLAVQEYGAPHAIVLNPLGSKAQTHCEKYAAEFIQAASPKAGDIRLVMSIRDGEDVKSDLQGTTSFVMFDGGLGPSEISAYVAMRMVSVDGPGSTSLYRQLVAEYASFDASLAETLARMPGNELEALPNSLTPYVTEGLMRWGRLGWLYGTRSRASAQVHPLHEWYLATHSETDADRFRRLAERRYWQACVKSILPWMEERRSQIIEVLKCLIDELAQQAGAGGKLNKQIGKNLILVDRDDLEYADLSYQMRLFKNRDLSAIVSRALSVCEYARKVRHDLSHLRTPNLNDLRQLIQEMDMLIPATKDGGS